MHCSIVILLLKLISVWVCGLTTSLTTSLSEITPTYVPMYSEGVGGKLGGGCIDERMLFTSRMICCAMGMILIWEVQSSQLWRKMKPVLIDLDDPENGRVTLTGTSFGDTATFSCDFGYMLSGPETRGCMADGVWSNSQPTCNRKDKFLLSIERLVVLQVNFSRWYRFYICTHTRALTLPHCTQLQTAGSLLYLTMAVSSCLVALRLVQ